MNCAKSKGEHGPFLPVRSDRPDQMRDAPRVDDVRRFDSVALCFSRLRSEQIWEKEKPALRERNFMTNPSDAAFNDFWQAYPRKVGKFDALRAFTRALRVATVEEILSGVETYKTHKPDYADWSHPASWLNKGRWMDDYTPPPVEKPKTAAYKPYVPLKFRKDWGA